MVVEAEPPELLAQIVYSILLVNSVGCPQMVALSYPKYIPAGSCGWIANVMNGPPPCVASMESISVSFLNTTWLRLYEIVGIWSLTIIAMFETTLPPVLFA